MKSIFNDKSHNWRRSHDDAISTSNRLILVALYKVGTVGLKNKLAKQINHMMWEFADYCLFFLFFSFFYWHFSPPSSAFLLKLQLSRHEGPCGPDQMFQAAHFPTLCLMEYSWATRHHRTAEHHTDRGLFIYLFIFLFTSSTFCLSVQRTIVSHVRALWCVPCVSAFLNPNIWDLIVCLVRFLPF